MQPSPPLTYYPAQSVEDDDVASLDTIYSQAFQVLALLESSTACFRVSVDESTFNEELGSLARAVTTSTVANFVRLLMSVAFSLSLSLFIYPTVLYLAVDLIVLCRRPLKPYSYLGSRALSGFSMIPCRIAAVCCWFLTTLLTITMTTMTMMTLTISTGPLWLSSIAA